MLNAAPTEIILSQGRLADSARGAIIDAAALVEVLAQWFELRIDAVAQSAGAQNDKRDSALPVAKATLDGLASSTASTLSADRAALLVDNTCSAILATLPAAARQIEGLKVLCIGAHADHNTPEITGSSYLGGMDLAGVSGFRDSGHSRRADPSHRLFVGAGDIDAAEQALISHYSAPISAPETVAGQRVLDWLCERPAWVDISRDVIEPGQIPAAYAAPGEQFPAQLRKVLEAPPSAQIAGIELAEFGHPTDPDATAVAMAAMIGIATPLQERVFVR